MVFKSVGGPGEKHETLKAVDGPRKKRGTLKTVDDPRATDMVDCWHVLLLGGQSRRGR